MRVGPRRRVYGLTDQSLSDRHAGEFGPHGTDADLTLTRRVSQGKRGATCSGRSMSAGGGLCVLK